MMVGAIRIVIVEDHPLTRAGTGDFLRTQPDFDVVGEAENGREALVAIDSLKPDVVILDLCLPDVAGIEVARSMKELSPDTKGLVLTAFDDGDYILAVMQLGISGYLLKAVRSEKLADAVRKVSRGETVLDSNISATVAKMWLRRSMARIPSPALDEPPIDIVSRREPADPLHLICCLTFVGGGPTFEWSGRNHRVAPGLVAEVRYDDWGSFI